MGTAVFAGIPSRYIPPLRGLLGREAQRYQGWSFKFAPRNGKEPQLLPQDVNEIERLAKDSDDIHVLGWTAQSKHNLASASIIRQYFRFRWFPLHMLQQIGSANPEGFLAKLESDLGEESLWTARVKPADLSSPLLLPASCFKCSSRHVELWRHAQAYGDIENINSAEQAVSQFRREYLRRIVFSGRQQNKWLDQNELVFDEDGERHAIAPSPRSWKFSYRVIDGFHYDVTHHREREFLLRDVGGTSHRANKREHINVDPHGYVRIA
jgi:hypothetical protein